MGVAESTLLNSTTATRVIIDVSTGTEKYIYTINSHDDFIPMWSGTIVKEPIGDFVSQIIQVPMTDPTIWKDYQNLIDRDRTSKTGFEELHYILKIDCTSSNLTAVQKAVCSGKDVSHILVSGLLKYLFTTQLKPSIRT